MSSFGLRTPKYKNGASSRIVLYSMCIVCPYSCSSCFSKASAKEKIEIKNMKTKLILNNTTQRMTQSGVTQF